MKKRELERRLTELGFGIPDYLRFVPIDFEAGASWREGLIAAGFDERRPAIIASSGVSMYLTKETNAATLREVATLAPGSTFVMTFLLPVDLVAREVRAGMEMAEKGAAASGTPFISFFAPDEILALAHEAGFATAAHVSGADLAQRYFAGRGDGLRPPDHAEDLLVATNEEAGTG